MHDRDHHPKSELENQHPDSSRLSSSFLHGDEALIKAYMLSHFNTIRSLLQGAFYYISRNSMGRPTLWQCNIVFRRGDILLISLPPTPLLGGILEQSHRRILRGASIDIDSALALFLGSPPTVIRSPGWMMMGPMLGLWLELVSRN